MCFTLADYIGIVGNLMLLLGPAYELLKAYSNRPALRPSGQMTLLVVAGIIMNTTYQAMTVNPIPVWSFVQNFATIAIWTELYALSRPKV